jgi:hypothetical protein
MDAKICPTYPFDPITTRTHTCTFLFVRETRRTIQGKNASPRTNIHWTIFHHSIFILSSLSLVNPPTPPGVYGGKVLSSPIPLVYYPTHDTLLLLDTLSLYFSLAPPLFAFYYHSLSLLHTKQKDLYWSVVCVCELWVSWDLQCGF